MSHGVVHQGGPAQQGGLSISSGGPTHLAGSFAGRDLNVDRSRRFHIGSIRFGTGGLVALILAGTVGAGGAAVGVVAGTGTGNSASVTAAQGRWVHGGGSAVGCLREDDSTLVIRADGEFTLHVGISFDTGNACGVETVPPADFTGPQVDCAGKVTADGDKLVFRSTSGPCQPLTGVLRDGNNILDLGGTGSFVRA